VPRKRRPKSRNEQIDDIVAGTLKNRSSKSVAGGKIEQAEHPVLIRKTPVMWGIPCDEVMFSDFYILFEKHANKMPWDGFAASKGTYLPKARNFIHDAFLDSTDLPYLMMLDSDILIPPFIVDRLMAHKLPIVGAWYHDKNHETHHPVVYDFVSETDGINNWRHRDVPRTGLEKVDGIGAGTLLMTRAVAEGLGKSPYSMESGGEDMKLSRKLMQLGIPLYVDWDMPVAHAGVFSI